MEENLILENNPVEQPKRSQFLKVLCILSFIMCGISFLSGIWGIYQSTPEAMQKNVEQLRSYNPDMADKMEDQMIEMQNNPYSKIAPYLGLAYTLLSFLGVMMMWNLTKRGFYIYAIAEILPYTSFVFMGKNSLAMMGPPGGNNTAIAMGVMIFMVIVDIVFVAMYARTLKEMK
ncbi:MAG: hypothetical protein K0S53_2897 [Bacteroidetes bacterium]|jgi:hypothetical protein|nr:hypothetical protein [Bacteroidota bacterium]MDF2451137.1 hypothetical protein [Bacteroidota bacterium]